MSQDSGPLTIGVDLGGTKVEAALVDATGSVLISQRFETRAEKGPDEVISDIVASLRALLRDSGRETRAVGIAVAGQVDARTGAVRFAPNLRWNNVPLRERLAQALEIPVVVANDVRAATWGEWRYGAGKGVDDLICLFVGTGVGGGIVAGGQMMEGCDNAAGELGHITIVTDGRACRCPNRGCLEAYVGGWAIAERAQDAVGANVKEGRTLITLAGQISMISAGTVAEAYADGDPLARRLVEETAEYLAAGVVGIVNALNPRVLVLGGGVIHGIPDLATFMERRVRERALEASVSNLRIVKVRLGDKAGVVGAADLARVGI